MRFSPRRLFFGHFMALLLIAGSCWQPMARADLKLPDGRKNRRNNAVPLAPEAVPARVDVLRGDQVAIPLKGTSSNLGPMEFVIRDQPKHGALGRPQDPPPLGTEGAVVYRMAPGASSKVRGDSFTYVARIAGGGVSAPVTVTIDVVERVPNLSFQFAGSARPVPLGEPAEHTLTVANSGTGEFSCDLKPPAPWRVRDYNRLKLKPGEQAEIPLIFDPAEPRWHQAVWKLSDTLPDSTVKLAAESIVPFSLRPSSIELNWDPAANRQKGQLKVHNWGALPLTLQLSSSDPRLSLTENNTIPPGQEIEILLQLPEGDRTTVNAELVAKSPAWRETAKVGAKLTLARVTWKEQSGENAMVDFGTARIGELAARRIVLTNTGGQDGLATWKISPGFFVSLKDSTLRVPAGGETSFDLNVLTDISGEKTGELQLDFGHESLKFALRAEVSPVIAPPLEFPDLVAKAPITAMPATAAATEEDENAPLAMKTEFSLTPEQSREIARLAIGASVVERDYDPAVPTPRNVEATGAGSTWVELTWDRFEDNTVSGFVLEYLQMVPDEAKSTLLKKWIPVENNVAVVSRDNGRITVRLSKLPPEYRIILRVLAKDKMARFSTATLPLSLTTTKHVPVQWPWWLGGGVFLLLLGRWWKNRPRREPAPVAAEDEEPGEFVLTTGNVQWLPKHE